MTVEAVDAFLGLYHQKMDDKARQMYKENFLEVIRHVQKQELFFISGKVQAEMRKTTTYNTDVVMNSAGTIMETQCDCAVGMGPGAHCKHVRVVMHALCLQKDGIQTRETCTQVLQTFHKTKTFKGSPIKTAKLVLRTDAPIQGLPDFDPRPAELVKLPNYERHFQHVWLNDEGHDLPIRQLYPPANIWAYCHDHQYASVSHEELLLRSLRVSSVSATERQNIESATRQQAASSQWRLERQLRLQSSNFGRICKATNRTNFDLLAQNMLNPAEFRSKATDHGKKFEREAKRTFETDHGVKVEESGIWIHPDHPFLGCSPDGLINNDELLEIKCPYSAKDCGISVDTVKYMIEEEGCLKLDRQHEYYYQVQGQLMCTGRSACYFLVWSPKNSVVEKIERDNIFITAMVEKLCNFFNSFFKPQLLQKHLYRHTDDYHF